MRRYSLARLLIAGGIMAGCGSNTPTPTDSSTRTDAVVADTVAVDTPATGDTPATDGPATDGSTTLVCGSTGLPVINLNTLGTVTGTAGTAAGTITDYMGDTTSAWMSQTGGTPSGHQPIAPPSGNPDCPTDSGQVVLQYTTGATPSVLTISTSNPGTPPSFDTVVYVSGHCQAALTAAACNDDNPLFAAAAMREVTSYLSILETTPHSTIYIIIGGYYPGPGDGSTIDHGAYELTVNEAPPVAMSGVCPTNELGTLCANGLGCVGTTPVAPSGTCQPIGAVAGAVCNTTTPACTGTLTCDTTNDVCVNSVANGATCDAYNECGSTSTCVFAALGSPSGTCLANGALGSGCLPMGTTGGRCTTGLSCSTDVDSSSTNPVCVNTASAVGASCDEQLNWCASGMTCVGLDEFSFEGTCQTDGTAARTPCRLTGTACDSPLTCVTQADGTTMLCVNVAANGGACTPNAQCGTTATCILNDTTDRQRGTCVANGTVGGSCNSTTPNCASPATCSDPGDPTVGLCQNSVTTVGAACNTLNAECGTGLTCVLTTTAGVPDPVHGTCQTNGAAAGTACAPGATACTGSLTCDGSVLSNGTCETTLTSATAVCDSLYGSTRCPSGTVCRPTQWNVGACAGPTVAEMEPQNNSPTALRAASVPAITAGTSYTGTLPFADIDCVPVQVAMGGSILAQVDDGAGRCPVSFGGELLLDLYNTDGVTVRGEAQDTGPQGQCATIDGSRMVGPTGMQVPAYAFANNLAAGVYYVCARGVIDESIPEVSTSLGYVLHVIPQPAP